MGQLSLHASQGTHLQRLSPASDGARKASRDLIEGETVSLRSTSKTGHACKHIFGHTIHLIVSSAFPSFGRDSLMSESFVFKDEEDVA
jgi:hypothetical protein